MTRIQALCGMGVMLALAGCRAEPDTPLTVAAAAGDTRRVEELLGTGADPDEKDSRGFSALQWAARRGQAAAIRILLRAGADADLTDSGPNGWTPLMHAVHKRRTEAALALLEGGADVNAATGGGATALFMAAGYGDLDTLGVLLEAGADPYAETGSGLNALWAAAGGGALADITDGPPLGSCYPEVIAALRAKAPDLKLRKDVWTNALEWTARSEECASLLASLREK